MSTQKSVENCLECGQFFSAYDTYHLCKKCTKGRCKFCLDPLMIPSHPLDKTPHFCDTDCEAEFIAIEELSITVSKLIQSLDNLRKINYSIYEKGSFSYFNNNFIYKNNSDSQKTTFTMKIKHNSKLHKGLHLVHKS